MSDSGYTDESYTTTDTAESNPPNAEDGAPVVVNPEEEEENGEEKAPEPEPEPEPDPLEGISYVENGEDDVPPYAEKEYWEKRYTDDTEAYDWYQDADVVVKACKKMMDAEGRVLVVGTGNSDVAPLLAQGGFESVTAIDFVRPCIVKSRRRNREVEGITWKVMDMRRMTFPSGDFATIIDKGTLDCLFYAGEEEVMTAMSEISRCLKKRGLYLCVSCCGPESRKRFFDRPADLLLTLEQVIELKRPIEWHEPHWLYVVRKGGKLMT